MRWIYSPLINGLEVKGIFREIFGIMKKGGRMDKKNKKCLWITLGIIICSVIAILKISYELKWLDVLTGIIRLETDKKSKVKRFTLKTLSFVTFKDGEDDFLEELGSQGWTYYRHYGRGMIFTKDGYEILMTKRVIFNRYNFYEVATREVFDLI